ncbi:hypothetical protein EQG49_12925 [Periweissella cryptocerci]|uniref:DUF4097 domain-containing protein n=1 Tax=Periweissella cryptocerci TaxID=2506420 RepID=A0A4P6YWS4_9LACO|nr:DUF4097 family beta strand repeat-containing protein [Periweissella cryptocerci]QBO37300.1 hypothetical protein EQG49_12925 [Periweissella cryptocerci]
MRFKKTIITGVILMAAGMALVLVVRGNSDTKRTITWDHGFKIAQYQRKTISLNDLKSVKMDLDNFDVQVVRGSKLNLQIKSPADVFPTVTGIDDGHLQIIEDNKHTGDFNLSLEALSEQVVLTVPKKYELSDLMLETDNGRLSVVNIKAQRSNFKTDNGRMQVTNSKLGATKIKQENGSINVTNTVTGVLNMENENGSIELADLTLQGHSSIENENGRINVTNANVDGYTINSDNGTINVDGKKHYNLYHTPTNGANMLNIENSNGDITVTTHN